MATQTWLPTSLRHAWLHTVTLLNQISNNYLNLNDSAQPLEDMFQYLPQPGDLRECLDSHRPWRSGRWNRYPCPSVQWGSVCQEFQNQTSMLMKIPLLLLAHLLFLASCIAPRSWSVHLLEIPFLSFCHRPNKGQVLHLFCFRPCLNILVCPPWSRAFCTFRCLPYDWQAGSHACPLNLHKPEPARCWPIKVWRQNPCRRATRTRLGLDILQTEDHCLLTPVCGQNVMPWVEPVMKDKATFL